MLKNKPFGFDLIRKYTVAFGSLFNEIQVVRGEAPKSGNAFPTSEDDKGNTLQLVKVPVSFARKDKLLARIDADPEIQKQSATLLPRISFEMTNMWYAAERHLGSVRKYAVLQDKTVELMKEQLSPVPYDLTFNLYVFTKYQEEGNQIIEQILPYFSPSFPIKIDLIPEMFEPLACPVTLLGVQCEDLYGQDFKDRRSIVWTLRFNMQAYFFGPIRRHPIIKFVDVNMYDATLFDDIETAVGNAVKIDEVTVQPGLTANGQPTTDITQTIPYANIHFTDDWGVITTIAGNINNGEDTGGE